MDPFAAVYKRVSDVDFKQRGIGNEADVASLKAMLLGDTPQNPFYSVTMDQRTAVSLSYQSLKE